MSTTRRRARTQHTGRTTAEAVEAFRTGDRLALHRALRLPPWQASPLDAAEECPWPAGAAGAATWAASVALREELEAAA